MTLRPSKTGTEHAHPSFDAGFVHSARRFVVRRVGLRTAVYEGISAIRCRQLLQTLRANARIPEALWSSERRHASAIGLPAAPDVLSLGRFFPPRKESYLDPGILHGHRLLKLQPLGIDSHSFRTFVEQYDLHLSHPNRNILRLLEIREGGYFAGFADQREYPASLRSGFSEIDSALHRQIAHGVSQYGSINRSQLDTQARKEAERLLRDRYDIVPDSGDPRRMVCRQSAATKPMNKNRIKR